MKVADQKCAVKRKTRNLRLEEIKIKVLMCGSYTLINYVFYVT